MLWPNSQLACAQPTSQTRSPSTASTQMSLVPSATLLISRAKYPTSIQPRSSQSRLRRSCLICKWATTRRVLCLRRAATIWATLQTRTATRPVETSSSYLWSRVAAAIWTWWTCSTWTTHSITTRARSARPPTLWKLIINWSVAKRRTRQHSTLASTWRTRLLLLKHSSRVSFLTII